MGLVIWHPHAFIARTRAPRHPLTLSHYWSKWFVRIDAMHCKDLRGLHAIAAGSLFMHLVHNCAALGATVPARLEALNVRMKVYQTRENRTEHPMPALRLENLKLEGWHMLNGKLVKAANNRSLVPFLQHCAYKYLSPHGGYSSATRKVCDALVAIERIMYSSNMFFDDAQKLAFKNEFLKLGQNWMYLRNVCYGLEIDAWQIRPKVHYCCHLPSQGDLINPRFTQVYGEESLIGKVARVWRASAQGPFHATIQKSALSRYATGLEVRLT